MKSSDLKGLKQIQVVLFFAQRNVDLGLEVAVALKKSLAEHFSCDPVVPPYPKDDTAIPLDMPRIIFQENGLKIILSKRRINIEVKINSLEETEILKSIIGKICDCLEEQTFSRIGIIFEHEDNSQDFIDTVKKRFLGNHNKVTSAKEFTLMWANRFDGAGYQMNLAHTVFCSTLPDLSGNTIGNYVLDYNTVPEEEHNLCKNKVNEIWTYCSERYGEDKNVFGE